MTQFEVSPFSGHTELYALLGSPVRHSLSPAMHNNSFRALGIDAVYVCFEVNESTLEDAIRGIRSLGIRGCNLTMPNKNNVLPLLDELSPAAEMSRSVNTILAKDGKLIGHNTDGLGFWLSAQDKGHNFIGKNITVLGGGGASTAICSQAALDGIAKISLCTRSSSRFHNRTLQLVEDIRSKSDCTIELIDLSEQERLKAAIADSALLINTTSVGMAPNTEGCLIPDKSWLRPELVVADIIYNPQETRLLSMAKEAGCSVFNGMFMLLYQGAEAFRIWTGQDMPVELIKEIVFNK